MSQRAGTTKVKSQLQGIQGGEEVGKPGLFLIDDN